VEAYWMWASQTKQGMYKKAAIDASTV